MQKVGPVYFSFQNLDTGTRVHVEKREIEQPIVTFPTRLKVSKEEWRRLPEIPNPNPAQLETLFWRTMIYSAGCLQSAVEQ